MFEELKIKVQNCNYCEKKFGFKPHPIFWGKKNSKIAQISQAPSNNVHNSGQPFTDMSGKTLKYDWYKITDKEFYDMVTVVDNVMYDKDDSGLELYTIRIYNQSTLIKK